MQRVKDPNDPQLAREGYVMADGDFIWNPGGALQTVAFTPLLMPVGDQVNNDFGASGHLNPAFKLYALYRDTDLDFAWQGKGSRAGRFGFDFARNLETNFEIHGEWARILQFSQPVTDAAGHTVATNYGPADAGVNHFVWNLRYQAPVRYRGEPAPRRRGGAAAFFFGVGGGPTVAPGTYKVAVTVNDQTQTQTVSVVKDPGVPVVAGAFASEVAYGLEARDMMSSLDETLNHIDELDHQISSFAAAVRPAEGQEADPRYKDVLDAGRSLHQSLDKLKNVLWNTKIQRGASEDDLHWLSDLHAKVEGLLRGASIGYGQPVSSQAREQMTAVRQELATQLADFNQIVKTQVSDYNKLAKKVDAPTLFAGAPVSLPAGGK